MISKLQFIYIKTDDQETQEAVLNLDEVVEFLHDKTISVKNSTRMSFLPSEFSS